MQISPFCALTLGHGHGSVLVDCERPWLRERVLPGAWSRLKWLGRAFYARRAGTLTFLSPTLRARRRCCQPAEPTASNLGPFPAVRVQSSRSDLGKGRVQLRQR
jgi:hypothetical protein